MANQQASTPVGSVTLVTGPEELLNERVVEAATAAVRRADPEAEVSATTGVQLTMATLIMVSPAFGPYAFGAAFLAAVMIFTHTFAFGLLARLDDSGRALTGTPAMLMVGSAIGPFFGGTLVNSFGYEALAIAAACLAAVERPGQAAGADRTFEAVWSVDPQVVRDASRIAATLADELRPDWREAARLSPLPDPPGASEDLRRATELFDRMVAYIDAAR